MKNEMNDLYTDEMNASCGFSIIGIIEVQYTESRQGEPCVIITLYP